MSLYLQDFTVSEKLKYSNLSWNHRDCTLRDKLNCHLSSINQDYTVRDKTQLSILLEYNVGCQMMILDTDTVTY